MPLYWPWWAGGLALAVVTVGCCMVARRPLGVSGILERMVNLREELAVERARAAAAAGGSSAFEAALLAATAEAFGGGSCQTADGCAVAIAPPAPKESALAVVPSTGRCEPCGGECASPASRPTVKAHAVFLVAIVAGGFLVRFVRGGWAPETDLGPTFARVVGTGARGALALVVGGVLVGLGTSVSGGCSTGHGLSGCSRLQPASVAATASFMATAVVVSLLLAGRLLP